MKATLCIYTVLIIFCLLKISESLIKRSSTGAHQWGVKLTIENEPTPGDQAIQNLDKMKRPFCNAFMGCGRKRSVSTSNKIDLNKIIPLYKEFLVRTKFKHKRPILQHRPKKEH